MTAGDAVERIDRCSCALPQTATGKASADTAIDVREKRYRRATNLSPLALPSGTRAQ